MLRIGNHMFTGTINNSFLTNQSARSLRSYFIKYRKIHQANVSNNLNSCLLIVNTVDKIYLLLIPVAPLSEFREGSDEERRCRHALCLCELEMVRCMGHNKDEIDTTKILYQQCNITGKTLFQDEIICIIVHISYCNKSLSKVKKKTVNR